MNAETTLQDLQSYISDRIYKLRISKNLSARELSLSLGQSPCYINKIENCKSLPSLQSLFYICSYFNISIKEFFNEL